MDFNCYIGFLAMALTIIGFVYGFLRNFKSDIDKHIDRLELDIKSQNARTDQLYQMFCDMQKDYHQKFYDLLKEKR